MTGPKHEWETDEEYLVRVERDEERVAEDNSLRSLGYMAETAYGKLCYHPAIPKLLKSEDPDLRAVYAILGNLLHDGSRAVENLRVRRERVRELNLRLKALRRANPRLK